MLKLFFSLDYPYQNVIPRVRLERPLYYILSVVNRVSRLCLKHSLLRTCSMKILTGLWIFPIRYKLSSVYIFYLKILRIKHLILIYSSKYLYWLAQPKEQISKIIFTMKTYFICVGNSSVCLIYGDYLLYCFSIYVYLWYCWCMWLSMILLVYASWKQSITLITR